VENNFFTSIWADGCNLNNVSLTGTVGSNLTARNNFVRGTGDDAIAINSVNYGVGKFGTNGSDLLSATVSGNVVERCGGNAYVQQQPALHIGNGGDGQGVGTVANAIVSNNTIDRALYNGVGFSTSTGIVFEDNTVSSPGLDGIVISPPSYPAPTGSATLTGNVVTGLDAGNVAFSNLSSGYTVTQSGNSW